MSDGPNGINERILAEVLKHGTALGKIEEHYDQIDRRLDTIDKRLDAGGSHMHEQGTAIAMQAAQLARHERSISSLYKSVGKAEDTGVHHLIEERTRWSTLKTVSAIVLALFGAVGGSAWLSSIRCNPARAITPVQDAAVQAARR